jgi:hypothetical protein
MLEIYGDANPSNLPLKLLDFKVPFAKVNIISIALGPPITYIGTSGIVYLIILTIFHPGSEMHGIPASLTIATCLLYKRFLTISKSLVSEYVFNGIKIPLPFLDLVFNI